MAHCTLHEQLPHAARKLHAHCTHSARMHAARAASMVGAHVMHACTLRARRQGTLAAYHEFKFVLHAAAGGALAPPAHRAPNALFLLDLGDRANVKVYMPRGGSDGGGGGGHGGRGGESRVGQWLQPHACWAGTRTAYMQ